MEALFPSYHPSFATMTERHIGDLLQDCGNSSVLCPGYNMAVYSHGSLGTNEKICTNTFKKLQDIFLGVISTLRFVIIFFWVVVCPCQISAFI